MPKIINHDKYRIKLLDGCFNLFAEKGYSSLTMRKIAKELGVSTGTLYHYFKSKEEIYKQLVARVSKSDDDILINLLPTFPTLEERIDCFLDFMQKYEVRWKKVMFILIDVVHSETIDKHNFQFTFQQEIEKHIIQSAEYLQIDDIEFARSIAMLINGIILHRYLDGEATSFELHKKYVKKMILAHVKDKD